MGRVVSQSMEAGTGDVTVTTTAHDYAGFSLRETAGSTAQVNIRDGSGGEIIAVINLSASETVGVLNPHTVRCAKGIVVDRVSGTTEGVIYYE